MNALARNKCILFTFEQQIHNQLLDHCPSLQKKHTTAYECPKMTKMGCINKSEHYNVTDLLVANESFCSSNPPFLPFLVSINQPLQYF